LLYFLRWLNSSFGFWIDESFCISSFSISSLLFSLLCSDFASSLVSDSFSALPSFFFFFFSFSLFLRYLRSSFVSSLTSSAPPSCCCCWFASSYFLRLSSSSAAFRSSSCLTFSSYKSF
jgi:hypothetical protein